MWAKQLVKQVRMLEQPVARRVHIRASAALVHDVLMVQYAVIVQVENDFASAAGVLHGSP